MRTTLTSPSVVVLARSVRRASTALAARMRAERGSTGLTLTAVAVLGRLVRNDSLTPGEVAAQLGAQPQSMTRTFAALERDLLIVRTPDPIDRRQAVLTVTGAGRQAIQDEMCPRDAWLAQAMTDCLTPDERDVLAAAVPLLERLADLAPTSGPRRESR